jgi:hypothetical protein
MGSTASEPETQRAGFASGHVDLLFTQGRINVSREINCFGLKGAYHFAQRIILRGRYGRCRHKHGHWRWRKTVSQWRGGVGTRGTRTINGQESGDDSCLHIGGRWMKLGERPKIYKMVLKPGSNGNLALHFIPGAEEPSHDLGSRTRSRSFCQP